MKTRKVALTIPSPIVSMVDDISKQKGMSRSKYISCVLNEKIIHEKERRIREAYDMIFSDALIQQEQLETAAWLGSAQNEEGQEW